MTPKATGGCIHWGRNCASLWVLLWSVLLLVVALAWLGLLQLRLQAPFRCCVPKTTQLHPSCCLLGLGQGRLEAGGESCQLLKGGFCGLGGCWPLPANGWLQYCVRFTCEYCVHFTCAVLIATKAHIMPNRKIKQWMVKQRAPFQWGWCMLQCACVICMRRLLLCKKRGWA